MPHIKIDNNVLINQKRKYSRIYENIFIYNILHHFRLSVKIDFGEFAAP